MRLHVDEDLADPLILKLLQQAHHDVEGTHDAGLMGAADPVQFMRAIQEDRVLLTGNHEDFLNLHALVLAAQGHHPGVLVVRRDNDPRRDLTPRGIVHALDHLVSAGIQLADKFQILNHWR